MRAASEYQHYAPYLCPPADAVVPHPEATPTNVTTPYHTSEQIMSQPCHNSSVIAEGKPK